MSNYTVTDADFKGNIGNFMLSVTSGDLTQQTHSVIVNSIIENMDLTKGIVSKAILTAAGHSIQFECGQPSKLKSCILISTSISEIGINKHLYRHLKAETHK